MNNSEDIVLYRPNKRYPAVIVNDTGITYTPSNGRMFTFNTAISWSQIAAIYPSELSRQKRHGKVTYSYLAIVPKDASSFLNSYPFFKRLILAVSLQRLGTPVGVFSTFLPISVEDLFTQIRTRYSDKFEMYGIRTEQSL
jgi:hypothetical protein